MSSDMIERQNSQDIDVEEETFTEGVGSGISQQIVM